MSSRFYRLPDMLAGCPQKSGSTNVNAQVAKVQVHRNCGNSCLIAGNNDKECKSAQAAITASYCYLQADAKAFRAIVDFFKAGFILETITDTATVEDARNYAFMYMTAFGNPVEGIKSKHPFVKLISSMAISVNELLGDFHRRDFLDANSTFAHSIIQEALDRKATQDTNAVITVETYLVTRKASIAIVPALVLARSAGSLNICSELLNESSVRGMEEATVDLILISNDIYSYKKELAEDNASHNLLTVLMQDPQTEQLDLQGAINHAGHLFESALAHFKACRAKLPSVDEETNRMLAEYSAAMVDLFVGGIEWSLTCTRYSIFDSEENRQKGLMLL